MAASANATESVLQPWVEQLPLKTQSNLLAATRGPDHAFARNAKRLTKFVRGATQKDADPSSDFMPRGQLVDWKGMERELEFAPLHYVCHLLEALATIERHAPPEYAHHAAIYLAWVEAVFHIGPVDR